MRDEWERDRKKEREIETRSKPIEVFEPKYSVCWVCVLICVHINFREACVFEVYCVICVRFWRFLAAWPRRTWPSRSVRLA